MLAGVGVAVVAVAAGLAPAAAAAAPDPVRISVADNGALANNFSHTPSVDATGASVAFASDATNLAGTDTNNATDVFVRDRDPNRDGVFTEPGRTVRVSTPTEPVPPSPGGASFAPDIDRAGRHVVFRSAARLVPEDTNGVDDIYLHDRDKDGDGVFDEPGQVATRRSSIGTVGLGAQGNGASISPAISPSGRFVAFVSAASNFSLTNEFGRQQIFLHDRDADGNGTLDEPATAAVPVPVHTILVSHRIINNADTAGNGNSSDPDVTDTGVVAFTTEATNLLLADTNGTVTDVLVAQDASMGVSSRANVSSSGAQLTRPSGSPSVTVAPNSHLLVACRSTRT